MTGIVYLVGAGPGDPGLLTMRAADLLGRAQVLVYDYLAAPAILGLVPSSCRRIYVGKKSGCHAKPQLDINQLLVDEARAGQVVVRLKGGDPYIFGRGGEEAQELFRAGIPFEEVPGISSTVAAAAYAGIPLTHRDFNSQVALVTGHERPDKTGSAHDWSALASMGTVVSVMGVKNLAHICSSLISAGRSSDTPAALIQWGTTCRQKTIVATLADLPEKGADMGPPALLVIGGVVGLRDELNWFENRALFGQRILVTRSRKQASRLTSALAELGAEVWERPTIDFEPLDNPQEMEKVLASLPSCHWLVFTSPNGAEIFMQNLLASGRDVRALGSLKIAVVGPAAATALRPFGLIADLVPKEYVAESLLEALVAQGISGQKIVLARAQEGRDIIPQGLLEAGAELIDLPLYKTFNPPWDEELPGVPDLVTFTSSSTATGLAALIAPEDRKNYPAASIGPVTSRTARELGFDVVAEATKFTIDGLVQAVADYFKTNKQ